MNMTMRLTQEDHLSVEVKHLRQKIQASEDRARISEYVLMEIQETLKSGKCNCVETLSIAHLVKKVIKETF